MDNEIEQWQHFRYEKIVITFDVVFWKTKQKENVYAFVYATFGCTISLFFRTRLVRASKGNNKLLSELVWN